MALRRAVWRIFSAAASLCRPGLTSGRPECRRRHARPASRRDGESRPKRGRASRHQAAAPRDEVREIHPPVQPSAPVPPQVSSGVTSGSATAGPAYMQPTAASAMTISGAEVNARPFSRVGEALEVVPGLIVTQHSGEGKANQYFLRGFNLDHGTDLAIRVDGMPVNMPTHGHGQGYADINFMIPGTDPVGECPQGSVLRRRRRLRLRRLRRDRLHQQAAQEHRGDDQRQLRLSPRAGGRVDGGRCGHVARGGRGRQIQRPVGRAGQCAQDQRRAALQPGHRHRRLHADRRWPIPTAGIRPIRWRSARSTRASSAGSARSIRPMAALRAASRCRAIGRNRANTGRARSTPM